jgi:hypothetical protein
MDDVAPLASLFRDEIAAVASYRRALGRVRDPDARDELVTALASHERRAAALGARIAALGADPPRSPGLVASALERIERLATLLGDRPAVAVLAEEESRTLARYREQLARLDPESHALVREKLLPAQEQTYYALSTLRMALH